MTRGTWDHRQFVLLGAILVIAIVILLVAVPKLERPVQEPAPFSLTPVQLQSIETLSQQVRTKGFRWQPGVTSISHLSPGQFQAMLGAHLPLAEEEAFLRELEAQASSSLTQLQLSRDDVLLPERWDWREQDGLTSVRNQGSCGSCWAFAATGALEGILQIYDSPVDISEQHAINCNLDQYGCDGGWMTSAYRLWRDSGAYLEEVFPYQSEDGARCETEDAYPHTWLDSWTAVSPDRDLLKQAILVSPVAGGFTVYPDFQHYTGGVYENEGIETINHAVVLVGWDDALGAWIIRNSWGMGWGEYGYAYIAYDNCRLGSYVHQIRLPVERPVKLHHAALADTLAEGVSLLLEAQVASLNAELDPEVSLYVGSGRQFTRYPMQLIRATAYEGAYRFELPAYVVGDKIRYYLEAADVTGVQATLPAGGAADPYQFSILRRVLAVDFEAPGGWQAGLPEDDATAGQWEWGQPELSVGMLNRIAQPDGDHTPEGQFCFVTGARAGAEAGENDVDDGCTTLVSPSFDLSELDDARLRFWIFFTNHAGHYPWDDDFVVRGSSDGGQTWVDLHRLETSFSGWQQITIPLTGALPLSDQVQFRFVAADSTGDSVVEAALDDIEILSATPSNTDVDDGDDSEDPNPRFQPSALQLRAAPNPFSQETTLHLSVPETCHVNARLYDAAGRLVRVLWRGDLPAGEHLMTWDGRGTGGSRLAAGRYWARVDAAQRRVVRPVTLLR